MALFTNIGMWCNGNTTDFDSVVTGSTPVIPIIAAWVKIPTSPADNRLGKTPGVVFIYERDGNRV